MQKARNNEETYDICELSGVKCADNLGWLSFAPGDLLEAQILVAFACLLAIYLHKSNIKRLLHGNENKFSFKSKRD